MQTYLLAAGILAVIVGLVHSVLGEILIFRQLRASGVVPDRSAPPLQTRHIRIIWASWHAVTLFGWSLAGVLLAVASPGYPYAVSRAVVRFKSRLEAAATTFQLACEDMATTATRQTAPAAAQVSAAMTDRPSQPGCLPLVPTSTRMAAARKAKVAK